MGLNVNGVQNVGQVAGAVNVSSTRETKSIIGGIFKFLNKKSQDVESQDIPQNDFGRPASVEPEEGRPIEVDFPPIAMRNE